MFIVQKYIRIEITILKFFIWVGILSYIWLEIMFYGSADMSPFNKISDRIPTANEKFEHSYPLFTGV